MRTTRREEDMIVVIKLSLVVREVIELSDLEF